MERVHRIPHLTNDRRRMSIRDQVLGSLVWIPFVILFSLMLILLQSTIVQTASTPPSIPTTIELGLLLPFTGQSITNQTNQLEISQTTTVAAVMAINHINMNLVNILPITSVLHDYISIILHLNDTTTESTGALQSSLYQSQQSNILATIVGTSSTSTCIPASFVGSNFDLPLMSMSCTTPLLSDKLVHPTFMRVVPSDEAQGALLANLVLLFGWKRICIVETNEIYGTSVSKSLQTSLTQTATSLNTRAVEVTILRSILLADPSTLNQQLNQTLVDIQASGTRIVILCMDGDVAIDLLSMAGVHNMLTAAWVWLGSDAVTTALQGQTNPLVLNNFNGFIGVVPLVDTTSTPYQQFTDVWQQQNVSDYLSFLPDLPSDIFAQPPRYFHPALTYDIILAYSLAAKQLIDQGAPVTRQSILTRLRQSDFMFDGVTRTNISFDSSGNAAPAYAIMNVQINSSSILPLPSLQILSQVRMNGTSADQLVNTPIGRQILTNVQFHNRTNVIPSDRDVALFTTINFLITHEISFRHLPVDSSGAVCAFLFTNFTLANSTAATITKNCTGGFSRRLAYFQSTRANYPNVLAVDTGSAYYPSTYFTFDQGVTVARWMSAMEYDIMAISSLDVALGASVLVQYLNRLQPSCAVSDAGTLPQTSGACMIATTFAYPSGSVLSATILLPYVIKLVGSNKVGFVSIEKSDFATSTNSNGEFTIVADEIDTLQATINHLRQSLSCHIIILIAVSYLPPSEPNLIAVLNQVSGINMALLYWSDIDSTSYHYTLLDVDQNVVQVIRVNTDASDIMHATVTFDNLSGEPISAQTQVRSINLVNGSPEVLSVEIEEANALVQVNQALNQPIATASVQVYGSGGALANSLINSTESFIPISQDGCRVNQCPVGSFLTDIMLTFCTTCTIAHINGGSIRSSLLAGPISRASILSVIPFSPTFSTYEMKGSDIFTVLKYSISKAGAGGHQQWAGIRFAYTIDRTIIANTLADRVILTYTEVMTNGVYQPIQASVTYKIVAIGFTVGGGDGFTMIASLGRNINNYALPLVDWTVLKLQGGLLDNYQIKTRSQLQPCWNQTYTLAQDPTDTSALVWPNDDCREISGVQGSNVELCPALQTIVTTTITNATANVTVSSCQCISSYERSPINSYTCQHCDVNFLKQFPGDHPCVCDSTHYFIPTFLQGQPLQCVDPTGYTEYTPAADDGSLCKICPPCIGCLIWDEYGANFTNYAPTADSFDAWSASWFVVAGWWWDTKSNIIYKCPTGSSRSDEDSGCKGTEKNTLPCKIGSTGPLCLQCEDGYGATSHNRCAECPSRAQSITLFLFSLIGVLLFLILVVYSSFLPRSHSSTSTKILVRHLQTCAFIGAFRISDGDIVRGLTSAMGITNNSGAKALAFDCIVKWNAIDLMRISSMILLILFFLVVLAMVSREIRKRKFPTEDDGKVFKVLDARTFLCSCCSSNRRAYQQENVDQGSIGGVLPSQQRVKLWSWEQVCLPVCTVIILFLYPSLVLESVRFLVPCFNLNGERLMTTDTSISCTSSDYIQTWWCALFRLIVIGLGTPVMMIIRLRAYRRSLSQASDSRSRESRSFFLRYRFLIEGYTDAAWFWDVVNMARHVSMVLCVVFLTTDEVTQSQVGVFILMLALLLNMYYKPFREPTNTIKVEPEIQEKPKVDLALSSQLSSSVIPFSSTASSNLSPAPLSPSMNYVTEKEESASSNSGEEPNKRKLGGRLPSNGDSSGTDPVVGGLNLNYLESISIAILIITIILIAMSHADVVRGASSSTATTFYMNQNKAVAYGESQIYGEAGYSTTNSSSSMSGYALMLQWWVVIIHLAFILFVIFFGFPHLRSIKYWRARGTTLMKTVRRLSTVAPPTQQPNPFRTYSSESTSTVMDSISSASSTTIMPIGSNDLNHSVPPPDQLHPSLSRVAAAESASFHPIATDSLNGINIPCQINEDEAEVTVRLHLGSALADSRTFGRQTVPPPIRVPSNGVSSITTERPSDPSGIELTRSSLSSSSPISPSATITPSSRFSTRLGLTPAVEARNAHQLTTTTSSSSSSTSDGRDLPRPSSTSKLYSSLSSLLSQSRHPTAHHPSPTFPPPSYDTVMRIPPPIPQYTQDIQDQLE